MFRFSQGERNVVALVWLDVLGEGAQTFKRVFLQLFEPRVVTHQTACSRLLTPNSRFSIATVFSST